MKHWNNTLIRDKLLKVCEEQGVLVVLQPSAYKSQRCFKCGLVKKSSRNGEEFRCPCGNTLNADYNSALNQTLKLCSIPSWLFKSGLNLTGFYWGPKGVFGLDGEALTVPLSTNKEII